jgi:hypothetical protein
MVSLTPRPFCPPSPYPVDRRLGGPQSSSQRLWGREKSLVPVWNLTPAVQPGGTSTELYRLRLGERAVTFYEHRTK